MQAPIGPATTPQLVAAVSNCGGLGCLAASWTPLATLRQQIHAVQRDVDRPFCVNLVLAFDQRERLELLVQEHVSVVSFSWGADPELMRRAQDSGMTVITQVGSLTEARAAVDAGADVLMAQGIEAGGHVQAIEPLLTFLHALRARFPHPIVGAGGISSGRAARIVRAAGADAVASGTAFLAAHEADVHPAYLASLLQADGGDTVLTSLFDVGWPDAPHRVLRNSTVAACQAAGMPSHGHRPGEGEIIATRHGRPIVRYSDAQPTTAAKGDVERWPYTREAGLVRSLRVLRRRRLRTAGCGRGARQEMSLAVPP